MKIVQPFNFVGKIVMIIIYYIFFLFIVVIISCIPIPLGKTKPGSGEIALTKSSVFVKLIGFKLIPPSTYKFKMNRNYTHNSISIILRRIRQTIEETYRLYESTNCFERNKLISCFRNLERIRSIISIETYNSLSEAINSLLLLPDNNNETNFNYSAERLHNGSVGRPAVKLPINQLLFLYNEGYTKKAMAKIMKCSVSVVSKTLYAQGIRMRSRYTNMPDEEIKTLMDTNREDHPNCGSEMMAGYLKSKGIILQRERIRKLLIETDPLSAAKRWSQTIKRRHYKVPTPNSLWHMDSHCKLSRWGFIIHGCIDGYSRLIVYLSCATSIQAEPVLNLFVQSTKQYGIPSRVRSDHGYENLFVAFFMNLLRGLHRGSHITGKSVHNQRIERLWVDVYKEVEDVIYNELYQLEDDNLLDPDNNIQRYCCQYIYLPVINNNLSSFTDAWNLHKIRTAKRRTPRQIWLDGMLENCMSSYTATAEVFTEQNDLLLRLRDSLMSFGIDSNIVNINITSNGSLFTAHLNLNNEQIIELERISSLTLSSKEKYVMCVEYLSNTR